MEKKVTDQSGGQVTGQDARHMEIEVIRKLNELKGLCDGGVDGYKRRAVDFPSLMLQGGLEMALIFYLSKSNEDDLLTFFKYWKTGGAGRKEDMCREVGKGSKSGYSSFTATVLYILSKDIPECDLERGKVTDAVVSCLDKVSKDEIRVEKRLTPTLVKIKGLSEMIAPGDNNE
ncbi:hypothetical protein [Stygiolobus caldivivus]|uniref:CRISPR type III-B/RAMP module-associated protein Cmr5 n=1 Tax=Stygiolobus caldivivus TaxID=2824673 RepID=A0A8D5U5Q5_9CREN|nr:hypothetical protein [Stygiolobus caldivivus]BCU70045.1 hypothetical protein KN1_13420 [Stygiolobus caldivivus]